MRAVAQVSSSPIFPLLLCATFMAASPALATAKSTPKVHVVDAGQRLELIARRYGVSVASLRNANALDMKGTIRPGQTLTIPNPKRKEESFALRGAKANPRSIEASVSRSSSTPNTHRVAHGDTLGQLAVRYDTSVETLRGLNGLGKEQPIREGQLLILPGRGKSPGASWQRYVKPAKQKGYLDVGTPVSRFVGPVLDAKGRLRPPAVRALNALFGTGGKRPALPERLIRLLVKLSDTFGGRAIRVVSGYRTTSYYEDSRHKFSSAVDFTVAGIPNAALCDYLRGLENVGVGYYPNSTFVHLDVRNHSAYWVDYSGPGEPPRSSPNAPRSPRPVRKEDRKLLAELDALLANATAGIGTIPPGKSRGRSSGQSEQR